MCCQKCLPLAHEVVEDQKRAMCYDKLKELAEKKTPVNVLRSSGTIEGGWTIQDESILGDMCYYYTPLGSLVRVHNNELKKVMSIFDFSRVNPDLKLDVNNAPKAYNWSKPIDEPLNKPN
jgi:hypothetical protein